jgi:uncharacterized protein (TIRG00374 family)
VNAARKIWKIGWRLAVCALLMAWILQTIFQNEGRLAWERQGHSWSQLSRTQQWQAAWSHGPRELWRTLTLVDSMALLLSVLLMGLTILLGVVRWRMVLRVHGIDLTLGRAAEISLVAHFFNSFLLGSTGGDLLKAYYAARETDHKKTEAVVTVAVDRLLGLFAMLVFACAMMGPNLTLLQAHKRLAALAGFVLLMTIGCGLAIGLSFWGGVSRFWPKSRARLRKLPKGELLDECLDACREFGRRRGFILRTLGLSMLLNMISVFQYLAVAHGLNLNVSPVALFVIVPMITCVSALPITPSGLGVRENLYVIMLAVPEIQVPATSALSLSLLAYAGNLFWSLIGGIVYATLKERHHLGEVAQAGGEASVN